MIAVEHVHGWLRALVLVYAAFLLAFSVWILVVPLWWGGVVRRRNLKRHDYDEACRLEGIKKGTWQ